MPRAFSFRLATVLRVRRVEETRAREVFGAARREVVRRSVEARLAREACEALPDVLAPMSSTEFMALREQAGRLAARATTTAARLELAVAEHELARQEMVVARQKVASLERLAEHRHREWLDECVRAEAVELDDVVTARVAAARIEVRHDH